MPNETALNNVLLQSNANAGGYQITNSGGIALTSGDVLLAQNPTNALHAVTKQYADAIVGGAADRGIVAGAGGLNFAQDSDYTANRIPFATGTTTMGFSADITWDDGLKSLAVSGKIEQSGAANANYFEGPIAAGTSSSVAGNAIYTGRQTLTNTTGVNFGHVVSTSFFPTSASTGAVSSAYITGNTTSATGDLSGASFNGMHVNIGHSNTTQPLGTLRNIYSYAIHGPGAGVVTDFHGADFYIDANAGTGKITNFYELRLRSYVPTGNVSGNQWAIFQENPRSHNYFAGKVGIHDATNLASNNLHLWILDLDNNAVSGSAWGANIDIRSNPAAVSSANFKAIEVNSATDSANTFNHTGVFSGIQSYAQHRGTGTLSEARGVTSRATIQPGGGNLTTAIGLYAHVQNISGGSGTIASACGVYVEDSQLGSTGPITNRYGILQEGVNDANTFNGPTILNNTVTFNGTVYNDVARGELYQDDIGTTVTLTAANTWYQVAGTWSSPGLSKNITLTTAGGTMTPTQAGIYLVDWHLSGAISANNQTINAGIRKNGTTVVVASQAETTFASSSDTYGMSGMALVELNGTTDYIRMAVNNNTSAGTTFTVDHCRMTIIRVGN